MRPSGKSGFSVPILGEEGGSVSVRETIGSTIGATASAIRHLGWWLDWHARAKPTDGCRGIE